MKIYHLIGSQEWRNKVSSLKYYSPISLSKVGFIHCSTKEQVIPTYERRFHGKDMLVLIIDTKKLNSEVKLEDNGNLGEEHPHVYGRLPVSAVLKVTKIEDFA